MNFLKNAKDYYIIKKSGLFDEDWFKKTYNLNSKCNPIKYYLKYSVEKQLNPTKDFDSAWYLEEYEDVKKNGMDPFLHYIRHGIKEHRLTKPLILETKDKFSLTNIDYNPCFFKDPKIPINSKEVNIALFIKNDLDNLLPTEYIRLVIPFYHLFLKKNFNPTILHNEDIHKFDLTKFDIIIVQRDSLENKNAKCLVKICKTNNIKLIYEIDDDLISIDKNHPNYIEFAEKKETIKYLVSNSDIVTVSSKNLKDKLHKYNSNIQLIKNSINDMLNLENEAITNPNMIKIGYMGTLTHENDVMLVEKAMQNIIKTYEKKGKKVIFETIGVTNDKLNYATAVNIPFKYSRYPHFIRWLKRIIDWDIAIAPLENNNINKSKSEIKYLEYTSLKIPGIYSNCGAYSEAIINNKNGILIKNNTIEEWQSALITLIENENLRKNIVKQSLRDIKNNYSIDSTVKLWEETIEKLLTSSKKEIFNETSLNLMLNQKFKEDYDIIYKSNLFNEYEYPIKCKNPIYHYLKIGVFEGLNPSKNFNTKKYIQNHNINLNKTNPLVHFIKNFVNKFEFNQINQENIKDIYQNLENKVSIIIPIYNAYEDTKKCIESVLKYSTKAYELILINDASTDKRIDKLMNSYKTNPNIKIINNKNNLGFVTSINVGFENSNNDVVILNSDTIVTPKWLEKLTIAAYSNKKIATVTPFSNNAGAFSVPNMNKKNKIPKNLGINGMARLIEKTSKHNYLKIPTGNGFCMYIKREIINLIGYFDDKTFKRGYGEENDFCMRAKDKGWENILDDSTYIFHNESSSFGNEKKELIKKNSKLLIKKHPSYENEVNKFINSKELHEIQKNIYNTMLNEDVKKRILYFNKIRKNDIEDNENYLLCINKTLILYYVIDNFLFKIKEWPVKNIEETCFNIIINLEIDKLVNNENFENLNKIILT